MSNRNRIEELVSSCSYAPGTRLRLWQNVIQQLSASNKYTGVFLEAGYTSYFVDGTFNTSTEKKVAKPDIICWSNETGKWLVIELSMDPTCKKNQLENDRYIDPQAASAAIGAYLVKEPDLISVSLANSPSCPDNNQHCHIYFSDNRMYITNENNIKDQKLNESLSKANGKDMKLLPQLPFTLIPEIASKFGEVKYGLTQQIPCLLAPGSPGMTVKEMVESSLDILNDKIDSKSKSELINVARKVLNSLVTDKYFGRYFVMDKDRVSLNEAGSKIAQNSKSREKFTSEIKRWGIESQSTLDTYL